MTKLCHNFRRTRRDKVGSIRSDQGRRAEVRAPLGPLKTSGAAVHLSILSGCTPRMLSA